MEDSAEDRRPWALSQRELRPPAERDRPDTNSQRQPTQRASSPDRSYPPKASESPQLCGDHSDERLRRHSRRHKELSGPAIIPPSLAAREILPPLPKPSRTSATLQDGVAASRRNQE